MERELYNNFCEKSPLSYLFRMVTGYIDNYTVIENISTLNRILKKFSFDITHSGLYFMCKGWGDETNYDTKECIEDTFNKIIELNIMLGKNYLQTDYYINTIRPKMVQTFQACVKDELEDFYHHFDEGLEMMFSFDNYCNKFRNSYNTIHEFLMGQIGDNEEIIEQEVNIRTQIRNCERVLDNYLDSLIPE